MSFINMPFGGITRPEIQPEGKYDLAIEKVIQKDDDSGLLVIVSFVGVDNAKDMMHNISFIAEGDDADKANWKLLFTQAFLDLFGVEWDDEGFDVDSLPGQTASDVPIIQNEFPQGSGKISNQIQLNPW